MKTVQRISVRQRILEPLGIKLGQIIADKYRIDRIVGVGGMGAVAAATHLQLGERRAIKFLSTNGRKRPELVERFLREARAAVRLKSDHAVTIHDLGQFAEHQPYIVMEYLEGHDLRTEVHTLPRLSVGCAVDYVVQALDAVAEAHALGIVHRDIKPANLFLARTPNGTTRVKVLDFGISKLLSVEAMKLTKTGVSMGSPFYMSPEHIRSSRDVDARTDIWSLGVVLYELLTGSRPFGGTNVMDICVAVTQDPPPSLATLCPEVPPGLEQLVMRCLEKDPADRPQSALGLRAALLPFVSAAEPRLRTWVRQVSAPPSAPSAKVAAAEAGATLSDCITEPLPALVERELPTADLAPPPASVAASEAVASRVRFSEAPAGRRLMFLGGGAAALAIALAVGGLPSGASGQPAHAHTQLTDDSATPVGIPASLAAAAESTPPLGEAEHHAAIVAQVAPAAKAAAPADRAVVTPSAAVVAPTVSANRPVRQASPEDVYELVDGRGRASRPAASAAASVAPARKSAAASSGLYD